MTGGDRPFGESRLLREIGEASTRSSARLVEAMAEVDRLLTAGLVTVDAVDPAELSARFENGFDPRLSLLPDAGELRPPAGVFLVARLHGGPVGCVGLKLPKVRPAEVKRMWVAPRARRLGLARRFLAEAEARAARAGHDRLRRDTNKSLDGAITLYRTSGFEEVPAFNDEQYADHWFEKAITPPPGVTRTPRPSGAYFRWPRWGRGGRTDEGISGREG